MPPRRRLSHAPYILVNRLAMPVGAFVLLIAIGRRSDALLGEYALVMTFYFIMQMLPLLGLTPYVMREVARAPAEAGRYFTTVGAMSLASCVLVDLACLGLVGRAGYSPEVLRGIAVVGVLIFPGILLFIAEILYMSMHRARPIAVGAVVENVARVALSVVALANDGGLVALMQIFLATRVAALAAYLVHMRRSGIIARYEPPDAALFRRTLAVLPSFLASTLLLVVFSRLDFVVLSIFERVEAIGYYSIGYRLFEIGILVLTALVMAVFPWFSRVYAGSRRAFRALSRSILLASIVGLAFACFAGAVLSEAYVQVLFARQYPKPVLLTQLFIVAIFTSGLDFVLSSLLHSSDNQRADARAMTLGGLVLAGLLALLVPAYGVYGAFAAKLAATVVQGVTKMAMLERLFGPLVGARRWAGVSLFLAAVAVAAVALLDAGWLAGMLAIAVAALVLPLAALALGIVEPLRMLRYLRRPGPEADPARAGGVLDGLAADARAHERRTRRGRERGRRMDGRLAAQLAWRVARFLELNGRPGLAGAVARLSRMASGIPIDPRSDAGPEGGAA